MNESILYTVGHVHMYRLASAQFSTLSYVLVDAGDDVWAHLVGVSSPSGPVLPEIDKKPLVRLLLDEGMRQVQKDN